MDKIHCIKTLRHRFEANGYHPKEGGHIGNKPLIFSAEIIDNPLWFVGKVEKIFFVAEFEQLNVNTLKQFSSACSHFAYDQLGSRFLQTIFPTILFSVAIAVTDQVDTDIPNVIPNSSPETRWAAHVHEYPVAMVPSTEEVYYPLRDYFITFSYPAKRDERNHFLHELLRMDKSIDS